MLMVGESLLFLIKVQMYVSLKLCSYAQVSSAYLSLTFQSFLHLFYVYVMLT